MIRLIRYEFIKQFCKRSILALFVVFSLANLFKIYGEYKSYSYLTDGNGERSWHTLHWQLYGVTREHIVALSVGLTLPPIISMELLRKAGLVMKNTMRHNTYCMVLCEMYSCKIEAVNQFLVSLNIPPLTRLGAKM